MQSARSSHLIKDVEPDVFRLVSRFIYTNCITFENLHTSKLIELMYAALRFQLTELAKLVESHLVSLIDDNTVFDLLNIAVKYKSTDLASTAMAFIQTNGSSLLNASNPAINTLTPAAMTMILQSDELPVDEMTLFLMAAEWAEVYCLNDGQQFNQISRSKSSTRASLNPLTSSKTNQWSPRSTFHGSFGASTVRSARKKRAKTKRLVSEVMSMIRYALLTPDQLREIEQKEEYRELIPTGTGDLCGAREIAVTTKSSHSETKCLADAWRILTFKQTGGHTDSSSSLPTTVAKRRAGSFVGTKKKQNGEIYSA
ncbi:unnamed protein product [Echinostoma caproni]|uniref:BACK domain-containing protein n=1 Tax=Echinostoma caproni TaxID=27848 RepID=A0A183ABA3_9TREM|nr:unnamed protein product [Echinostoma caproni]